MVQLNLLLDNRRAKSDGTYSIIFRIIQFKTVYTISSGISISKIHWDDKKRQVSHDLEIPVKLTTLNRSKLTT